MKLRINEWASDIREGAAAMLRRRPLETLTAVVWCVLGCAARETDRNAAWLAVLPLCFAVTLIVNNLAGRSAWRKIYWICWIPFVPLCFSEGLRDWLCEPQGMITYGLLVPLGVLLSRRALHNERFISDAAIWLQAGLLAFFFANAVLGLFSAILYSTVYIFGLEGAWIGRTWSYAAILIETLIMPSLFLILSDKWENSECRGQRMLEVLLNYIMTPALLIYAAMLYIYLVKILILWSLPKGGIAYLVFGFTLFALVVRALRLLLEHRMFEWFFKHCSLFLLPSQALFWAGALHRVGEYGLTEPRIYLLLCGGLMTLCVLLFLSRRTGRYYYACLSGFVCFAAAAYIPACAPRRIALHSQAERAVGIARSLERLTADGRLLLTPVPESDTIRMREYRQLFEALEYVQQDSALLARFGIGSKTELIGILPESMRDYVRLGWDWDMEVDTVIVEAAARRCLILPKNAAFELDGRYTRLYADPEACILANDTLRLLLGQKRPAVSIPAAELLQRQLERSGYRPEDDRAPTDGQLLRLLDYRDERCRILFEKLTIESTEDSVSLLDVSVRTVMLR